MARDIWGAWQEITAFWYFKRFCADSPTKNESISVATVIYLFTQLKEGEV